MGVDSCDKIVAQSLTTKSFDGATTMGTATTTSVWSSLIKTPEDDKYFMANFSFVLGCRGAESDCGEYHVKECVVMTRMPVNGLMDFQEYHHGVGTKIRKYTRYAIPLTINEQYFPRFVILVITPTAWLSWWAALRTPTAEQMSVVDNHWLCAICNTNSTNSYRNDNACTPVVVNATA